MTARDECSSSHATRNGSNTSAVLWRTIAVAMMAAFSTLCAAYFSIPRNMVTRPEVESMIQNSGPYIEDRKAIQTKLDDLSYQNGQIEAKIDLLINEHSTKQNR